MAAEPWRVVAPARATAADALASGIAQLESLEPSDAVALTWWDVDRDTLVLGRGSRLVVDERECAARGIPVVRRTSGGGPVLWRPVHLALDVHVPRGHALYTDDVVASYRWLGEAITRGLGVAGITGRLVSPDDARNEDRPDLARLACYAGTSPSEVMDGSRKIVGLSQVRRRTGLLMQAGIVLTADQGEIADLLVIPDLSRSQLGIALGTPVTAREARGIVRDAVERAVVERVEDAS